MIKTKTFFWRRLFAFTIDFAILVGIGYILGFIFFDFFAQFGGNGHFIGFLIALLYFGSLNSVLAKGQTVGKLLTRIRVTRTNGEYLSFGRSTLRYVIISLVFFCDNIPIPWLNLQTKLYTTIMEIIAIGLGLSIFYLLIFNRKKSQSLHDIIVDSRVISASTKAAPTAKKIWRGHYIVLFLFFVVLAIFLRSVSFTSSSFELDGASALRTTIEKDAKIVNVSDIGSSVGPSVSALFIDFFVNDLSSMNDVFANQVIVKTVKKLPAHRSILYFRSIYVIMDYNIGIAANWHKRPFSWYPKAKIISQIEAQGISEQGTDQPSGASSVNAGNSAKEAFHALEKDIYNKGKFREGLKMLYQASNKNPNEPWVYIAASLSALADGYTLSLDGYADRDWYDADTFRYGRLEQAIAIAERALELGPESSAAHAHLGRLLIIKNKNQEALKHLDKALEISPAGFYPLFYKGVYFEKNSKRERATLEKAQKYFESAKTSAEHEYQHSMINSHLQNIASLKGDKITQKRLLEESKSLKYKNPYEMQILETNFH